MITVNGFQIQKSIFPDKTSQVWQLPEDIAKEPTWNIVWHFEEERELMDLMSLHFQHGLNTILNLKMPYMPYARQDHLEGTYNFFPFSRFINSLGFKEVSAVDTHSPITCHLGINNFKNISVEPILAKVCRELRPDVIVFPDLGAAHRYSPQWMSELRAERIVFEKERDSIGNIKLHRPLPNGFGDKLNKLKRKVTVLIVDDICDGGATFLSINNQLRHTRKTNLEVHLFVTHGIFSKGREVLTDEGIIIHTTNTLLHNKDGISYEDLSP